jgi:hypothetical protein
VPEAGSLEFATDEEAVAGVEGVKTGRAMELWKGNTQIKVFPLNWAVEWAHLALTGHSLESENFRNPLTKN